MRDYNNLFVSQQGMMFAEFPQETNQTLASVVDLLVSLKGITFCRFLDALQHGLLKMIIIYLEAWLEVLEFLVERGNFVLIAHRVDAPELGVTMVQKQFEIKLNTLASLLVKFLN